MTWLACQEWPWICFWRAQGQAFAENRLSSMRASKDAGFDGWEGALPADSTSLANLASDLSQSKLQLRSLYANARLHDPQSAATTEALVSRCLHAKPLGLRVLVLNPEPIDWAQPLEKSDAELEVQRKALLQLQKALNASDIALAYHIHDSEMRSDAREFIAMLNGLPNLTLCMEAEWMLRGGWPEDRVLDFLRTHAGCISAAHLRQSKGGKFQLELGPDGFNYGAAAEILKQAGFDGPLVFEGYQEEKIELDEMAATLKRSAAWAKGAFG